MLKVKQEQKNQNVDLWLFLTSLNVHKDSDCYGACRGGSDGPEEEVGAAEETGDSRLMGVNAADATEHPRWCTLPAHW